MGKINISLKIKPHLWHLFLDNQKIQLENSVGITLKAMKEMRFRNSHITLVYFFFISCHSQLKHNKKCHSSSCGILISLSKAMQSTFSARLSLYFWIKKLPWCRSQNDTTVPTKPTEIGGCDFCLFLQGNDHTLLWMTVNDQEQTSED